MTSTELQAYNDPSNFETIAALTGASLSNTVYLPRLRINKDSINDDGKPIPMGTFAVTQDDKTFYGKTATFRVFLNRFQYQKFDKKTNKYSSRSILIKNFFEEAIDDQGGVSCGKVKKKDLVLLNPEQIKEQENIKCNRLLYGTVSIPKAITVDEEKEDIINLPVVMKLGGGQFMAPKEVLDSITALKHQYFHHELDLTLSKPQKNGATIYFNLLIATDFKKFTPLTLEDMETFKLFQEVIDKENNYVSKKFSEAKREAVKGLVTEDDINVLSALDLNDSLDDLLQ